MTRRFFLMLGLLALAAACGAANNRQYTETDVCGAGGCDACIGAQCPDAGTRDAGP